MSLARSSLAVVLIMRFHVQRPVMPGAVPQATCSFLRAFSASQVYFAKCARMVNFVEFNSDLAVEPASTAVITA